MRGFGAYLADPGWRGPGAPFGEPYAQGLGALAAYIADKGWRGPGAPFGLGDTPDDLSNDVANYVDQLTGSGPNAAGYGAGGTGSTSGFLQSFANAMNTGAATTGTLPPSIPTWVWLAGGVGLALFLAGAFKGGRR